MRLTVSDTADFPGGFAQHPPPTGGYSIATFEAALDAMTDELGRLLLARDYRAVFHLTYLTFSGQVLAALKAGRFADPAWAADMCCRFVDAYTEQLRRWNAADPRQCRAWRVAFGAAQSGSVNVLQAMLLGMNAHINYDLAYVTVGTCRHFGDLPGEDLADRSLSASRGGVPVVRYQDFLVVNQIGWESIPLIQDRVLATFSRGMYWANRATFRVTRLAGQRLLMEARDASWCHTSLLIHARDGEQRDAVSAMIDTYAASLTRLIGALTFRPWAIWNSVQAWGRRSEELPPGTASGLMTMARDNPVVADLALRQLASAGTAPVPAIEDLLADGSSRLAGVLATEVLRQAPRARRQEIRQFLASGSPAAIATVEAVLENNDTPVEALGSSAVAPVRTRWIEALERTNRCCRTPEVAADQNLTNALETYAEDLRRQLARLGEPAPLGSPGPLPAVTLAEVRNLLIDHTDGWVRLCARAALLAQPNAGDDMALLIERVLFLKNNALFMEVEPTALVHVAEHLESCSFAQGRLLVHAGDRVGGIHLIRAGRVEVSQVRGGEFVPVATLCPGDSVGELSAFNETAATADCRALQPVDTYFLRTQVLAGLLHEHPRVAIGLIRLLSRRLMATTLRVDND